MLHGYLLDVSNDFDLKLSHIKTFLVTIVRKSLREAARELGLTAATVGSHITALESFFGIKLLERSARGIKPTPEGLKVYVELKKLIDNLMSIKMRVKEEALKGKIITVASMELSLNHIVPCVISRFKREVCNATSFLLKRGSESYCLSEVKSGKADIAFIEDVSENIDMSKLEHIKLAEDRFVIVAPSNWHLSGAIALNEVLEKPLILHDLETGLGEIVKKFLEVNGLEIENANIRAVFPDASSVLMAISQELGLTIMPLTSIRGLITHYENLRVLPIKSCIEKLHFYAVRSKLHGDEANEFWRYLMRLRDETGGLLPCVKRIAEKLWRTIK